MAIWVIKDGQREGPYEEQDVRELIYEGTYSAEDQAIRGGQFDWSTLGKILDRDKSTFADEQPEPAGEESPDLPSGSELPAEPPTIPAALAAPAPAQPAPQEPMRVTVVDFQMPFGSMVFFTIKWLLACLAAFVIVGVLAGIIWTMLAVAVAAVIRH